MSMPSLRHRLPQAGDTAGVGVAEPGQFDRSAQRSLKHAHFVGQDQPLRIDHADRHISQIVPARTDAWPIDVQAKRGGRPGGL